MRRPVRVSLITMVMAACGFGQTATPREKISTALRTEARTRNTLPVFILLNDQPHREILTEVDEFYRIDRESAEAQYQLEMGAGPGGIARARAARGRLDAVTLRIRQQAMDRIAFRLRPQQEAMAARLAGMGATRVSSYQAINLFRADIPAFALAALESDPEIASVFLVNSHRTHLNVSVPATGAPSFWNHNWTGAGETVGVVDTGVTPHEAFPPGSIINAPNLLFSGSQQPGFADSFTQVTDMEGHGTHISGIIASAGSILCGKCVGMADGASVLNLKAGYLVSEGGTTTSSQQEDDVLTLLDWTFQHQPAVKVFNYSSGQDTSADDDNFNRVFDYLADAFRVTFVVSAGNNGGLGANQLTSPGTGYNVITVANADATGAGTPVIAPSSSVGPVAVTSRRKPDIAAPGTRISSTSNDGQSFQQKSGTSMAAPHIAGAAALLRSAGVTDSLAIKALLINSPKGAGWKNDAGWGFVGLDALATLLSSGKTSGNPAYAAGSLNTATAGAFQLLRIKPAAPLKATLVWNRHFEKTLNPLLTSLDLFVYPAAGDNNTPLKSTTGDGNAFDNVKQVAALPAGDLVLKVKANAAQPNAPIEPFAVAASAAAFTSVNGPALQFSCAVQTSSKPVANVPVNCTASISGDFTLSNASATYTGHSIAFGTLDPKAGPIMRTISAPTPSTSTPVTYTVTLAAQAFGETFSDQASFVVSKSDGDGTGGGGQVACSGQTLPSVSPTQITLEIGVLGGSFSVKGNCSWVAREFGRVSITSGGSGTGDGTVNFQVIPMNGQQCCGVIEVDFYTGPNTPPYRRSVTITQNSYACTFTVPATLPLAATGAGGVSGSIPVTASDGQCAWSAASTVDWMTLPTPGGTGTGAITLVAKNNPSSNPRSGVVYVTVAQKPVTVTQAGAPCTITLNPDKSPPLGYFGGLGGTFDVTVPNDCTYQVYANDPWIQMIKAKQTGPNGGNATITYGVEKNWSSSPRTGTISVGNVKFTVAQNSVTCGVIVNGATGHKPINVDAKAATGQVNVKGPAGCSWTLSSVTVAGGGLPFVHLSPPASLNGDKVITYTVDGNISGKDRSASFYVGGVQVIVRQAHYAVSTNKVRVAANGSTTFFVDIPNTASVPQGTSPDSWVHSSLGLPQIPSPYGNGWFRVVITVTPDFNGLPGDRTGRLYLWSTANLSNTVPAVVPVEVRQFGTMQ